MSPDLMGYMNGELRPSSTLSVPIEAAAGFYGFTVFEGIRSYQNKTGAALFRLYDHIQRLLESCRIIGVDIRSTPSEIGEWCRAVVAANSQFGDLHLRVGVGVLGRGTDDRGPVTSYVLPRAIGRFPGAEEGISLCCSSWRLDSANAGIRRAKVGAAYLIARLALLEAHSRGFEDAVLLDAQGNIREATGASVILVREGRLITPSRSVDTLLSITRETLRDRVAPIVGVPWEERNLNRADLICAEEVFLAGTGVEILPVIAVDGCSIGQGRPGELTRLIASTYFSLVRGAIEGRDGWLTGVPR